MLRALALLFLAPLLGVGASEARGSDLGEIPGQGSVLVTTLRAQTRAYPEDDLTILEGHEHHSLVLAVPVLSNHGNYSLCLLYDYARSTQVDPISGTGFVHSGSADIHNLGLGLRSLVTERLEFEAVMGHSHADSSSNSAYAGLIYDVDGRLGLGADLGRISANGQDDKRLRAFARFYF